MESGVEVLFEQMKLSAARAMDELPNENIVQSILKRSRSDISSSDDGTLHSADFSFSAAMESQSWSSEGEPSIIWKYVNEDMVHVTNEEYIVTEAEEFVDSSEPVYYYNPEAQPGPKDTSSESESVDVEVEDCDVVQQLRTFPPETITLRKRLPLKQSLKRSKLWLKKMREGVERQKKAKQDAFKYNELTELEDNAEQVAERFKKGCECLENCFEGFSAEKVFRHRLNIADLTKSEHDMYLMGVLHTSMQNPEKNNRMKNRRRMRNNYSYFGKKVCLSAFLYLEHVTLYQIKRLRKHLQNHGVTPRMHGNQGRKPSNTLPLDIYQRATEFVQKFIDEHCVDKAKNKKTCWLPRGFTKRKLHSLYTKWCENHVPLSKTMHYSTFMEFLSKQFPNLKIRKLDKSVLKDGNDIDDKWKKPNARKRQTETLTSSLPDMFDSFNANTVLAAQAGGIEHEEVEVT